MPVLVLLLHGYGVLLKLIKDTRLMSYDSAAPQERGLITKEAAAGTLYDSYRAAIA